MEMGILLRDVKWAMEATVPAHRAVQFQLVPRDSQDAGGRIPWQVRAKSKPTNRTLEVQVRFGGDGPWLISETERSRWTDAANTVLNAHPDAHSFLNIIFIEKMEGEAVHQERVRSLTDSLTGATERYAVLDVLASSPLFSREDRALFRDVIHRLS